MIKNDILTKENYEEPRCPLCMHPEIVRIPTQRVLERLNAYLDKDDYAAAERHLSYWLAEAEAGHDDQGKLTVLNEQIGLYRKCGKKEEGLAAITNALALLDELGLSDSVTGGTTCINAATGYKAFGDARSALPLYRRAQDIYEALLDPWDARLGGLYNNMALTLTEHGEYREAETLFYRALAIVQKQETGALEAAITYLNLADLVSAEKGPEAGEKEITAFLEKAETLLADEKLPRNGYYAFVCEKCAPVFGYYGWFLTESELRARAEEIHERA